MTQAKFKRLKHSYTRWRRDEKGAALIEFAVIFPILALLLMGSFEYARYVYINQKIQRTAMTVADLTSRTANVSNNELVNIFSAAMEVANPFPIDASGRIFLSSVEENSAGNPEVTWQETTGSLIKNSAIGVPNQPALLSDTQLIENNQSVIIAEVYFNYQPLFSTLLGEQDISHTAIFRPRLSITVERID